MVTEGTTTAELEREDTQAELGKACWRGRNEAAMDEVDWTWLVVIG
jgi:hypothetical protein